MSIVGARPYTCPNGHEFWVGGDATVYACPCCKSEDVEYDDEATPIYAVLVENIRNILTDVDGEDTDNFAYANASLEQCLEVGECLANDTLIWDAQDEAAASVLALVDQPAGGE